MAYTPPVAPVASTANSSTTPLAAGATFTGEWEDVLQYATIIIGCSTDAGIDGTVTGQFSQDGSTVTGSAGPWSFTASGSIGVPKGLVRTARYFRVVVQNTDASPQTVLRLQTLYSPEAHIAATTSRMNQTLTEDSDVLNVRAALVGQNDAGDFIPVPVTGPGHLEVEIHGPRDAFGRISTSELSPLASGAGIYGINALDWRIETTTGGTISTANGQITASIDTTANARAKVQLRRRLSYRPGQSAHASFTAVFPAGAASSTMYIGPISEEDGFAFGRDGTSYGVLHRRGGQRNIRTLTVNVGAGGSENVTVNLDDSAKVVAVTAGNTVSTAYQLSKADYSTTGDGWDAHSVSNTVVFICRRAKVTSGAFTVSSTGTAAGTFADTTAGVAPTDTWTPQASWSDPMLSGQGSTGVVLDPTQGQVYRVSYQFLGYGPAFYDVEYAPSGDNNPAYQTVYALPSLNSRTTPTVRNPHLPLTALVQSNGSTSALSMSFASGMVGIDGRHEGGRAVPPLSYSVSGVGVTEIPVFTLRNPHVYNNRTSQVGKLLRSMAVSAKGATNAIITVRIRRGATLTGTPNFALASGSPGSGYIANSPALVDSAATGVSGGEVLAVLTLAETGQQTTVLDIYMDPGEESTVTAQASTGSSSIVTVTLISEEYL